MDKKFLAIILCVAVGLTAAASKNGDQTRAAAAPAKGETIMPVKHQPFGRLPDGTAIDIFTLTNTHGLKARIMTYGAILVSLEVPDRNGTSPTRPGL